MVDLSNLPTEEKLAKPKYIVAGIRNYMAGSGGDQGIVFGEFRTLEFARKARKQVLEVARKKMWSGHRGIFLNGKFIEEI